MPKNVEELKKYENLYGFESKIYKFFEENRRLGFNFQEIYERAYPNPKNIEFDKNWKKVLTNIGGILALNFTLDNLKKKKGLKTIFSEGIQYYYLE